MAIQKKYLITGALAFVTISGAVLYWQYTKLMETAIKFVSLKINKASLTTVNVDLFLNFQNKSHIGFKISEMEYKVYLDTTEIAYLSKPETQQIAAKSTSPITINVNFNPSKIGKEIKGNASNLLLNVLNAQIRVEIKLKVELWFIKLPVPFTYVTTLGELMSPKK